MTQEAVEQVLGRLITDEQFRRAAADSLELACVKEGYQLYPTEWRLLPDTKPHYFTEFSGRLDPALCRA